MASLYVSNRPDSVGSLVNDLVLSLVDNLSKPVNCVGLSCDKVRFVQTSCVSRCFMPPYNAPNAVTQWRRISKMFWRLQMGFMSENHLFCCFQRWKCSIFAHMKKKTVRCFKCKNCIMWLLVISVVPLWMKILIRWFCTLKIFHLIYNL